MPGSVIRRLGHTISESGVIHYQEEAASWADADALAGRRVDRRRCYAIMAGDDGRPELRGSVRWTQHCTGCTETPEMTTPAERGGGCEKCGYRGVIRCGAWVPLEALTETV
jgi:hypothetical protein